MEFAFLTVSLLGKDLSPKKIVSHTGTRRTFLRHTVGTVFTKFEAVSTETYTVPRGYCLQSP